MMAKGDRVVPVPMADSIIAATALQLKALCITNDPHFLKMKELRTRWV